MSDIEHRDRRTIATEHGALAIEHHERGAMAEEQDFLAVLYRRLDELRRERIELRDRYVRDSDGTPGGRVERDVAYARHAAAVLALNAAEDRLCFGRAGSTRTAPRAPTNVDRRARCTSAGSASSTTPATRPAADGLARARRPAVLRRHRGRTAGRPAPAAHPHPAPQRVEPSPTSSSTSPAWTRSESPRGGADAGVAGEAALLAALCAPRTGRMRDIVETIQAEQDAIIRADRAGVLVVQGGPGTGKTAVALHRAAYLLYTHREQLARRGVLIVGPNATFLRYIGQVLPSLGETGVRAGHASASCSRA